jgi:orotidine-5'-phosphate decarboxylase
MPEARDRLIVAVDLPTASAAKKIVGELGSEVSTFKVGMQLFIVAGPAFVRKLVAEGRKVFLDLKFHDIPNTVAEAVRSASQLGVSMLTVHAAGGAKMLAAAAQAAAERKPAPLVLAVTVLTSLTDADLKQTGVSGRALDHVLRLASLARANGCGGVVASPQEVREIRRELGEGFAIVTPGVRPQAAAKGDQARVATPAEAIAAGASHIVVGRPIIEAADAKAAAQAILREIVEARSTR